jgi:hypothetical protein
MPDIRARMMECSEAEEQIFGLLGKALVSQWSSLPPPLRDQLVKQAAVIRDWDKNPQMHKQIMAIILKFQGYQS